MLMFKKFFLALSFSIISFILNLSALASSIDLKESKKCERLLHYFSYKHQIPASLLQAIAMHESGWPHPELRQTIIWPWTVHFNRQGYYFPRKEQAIRFVREKIKQGHKNIDIGLMQLNWQYHHQHFRNIDHMLSPRANIAYGASYLLKHFKALKAWPLAVGRYHSPQRKRGANYWQAVEKKLISLRNKSKKKSDLACANYKAPGKAGAMQNFALLSPKTPCRSKE